jgi:purine-binding chemotaxis protein CheW
MTDEQFKTSYDNDIFGTDDEYEDTLSNKFLTFKLGKESYGIEIKHIIQIIEIQNISEVPDMPGYVKGVINLRGKVIPVVDLRLRFSITERDYDNRTCIIVIEINNALIGVIVDTVEEVVEIAEDKVQPPPSFKTASGKDRYISGMGRVGENIKILLDVMKMLYEEDIQQIKESLENERVS